MLTAAIPKDLWHQFYYTLELRLSKHYRHKKLNALFMYDLHQYQV